MDYLLVFHANLNYGFLTPEQYPFVCEQSYLALFDFFNQKQKGAKWSFELSGYTLDTLCRLYPEAKEKITHALELGAEGIASPYAHNILPLFPTHHVEKALAFSMASWKKLINVIPRSGWIPECAWTKTLPEIYASAGLQTIIADYDSWQRTLLGQESLQIDLAKAASDPVLHHAMPMDGGGKAVLRTDCLDLFVLRYLHGELPFDDLKQRIRDFSQTEGYLTIYACDMEYVGTTAWYHLEKEGAESVFQPCPQSLDRLARLVDFLGQEGELITVDEAAKRHPALDEKELVIENGLAWHHGHVSQWESTPQSKYLNTQCKFVGEKLQLAQNRIGVHQERLDQGWWNLLLAESSDNGYPVPPIKPGEFNFKFGLNHFEEAQQIADQLTTDDLPTVDVEKL